ncbi:nucleoside deaminase [Oceanobacillus neutriphilus]|uniref:Cytidine/deoxycytidylate deaminase n=1 Tax=Oceanobacillus neutriphilus TaxID=531815 RepID=A0ABQ2NUF9_9BACI|nr:nucleoside deaminase [Oceanobacillus neutriphilus]GGP10810.1 putative cytidine/deoxycytidylate deaminase [Oceanobacillus neutriphilus]
MDFIKRTIELARENVEAGGRPFATVIVRDGKIIAESPNLVAQTNDPTAHAEIVAIREACKKLQTEHLTDCDIYILTTPCPMCLGALYYCSPRKVIYITTREEYAPYYKDDRKYFELETFYDEYNKPVEERRLPMVQHSDEDSIKVYQRWSELNPKGIL